MPKFNNYFFASCFVGLFSCSKAPPCLYENSEKIQANAGCLVFYNNALLIVEDLEGKYSPPGGGKEKNEIAQCTAERETWEETGIAVRARNKLKEFDNGFILFSCDITDLDNNSKPWRMEIKNTHWLKADELDEKNWRFPEQVPFLKQQYVQKK